MDTSTTPTAANGLWRAMRGSEMARVDIVGDDSWFTYIENEGEEQC